MLENPRKFVLKKEEAKNNFFVVIDVIIGCILKTTQRIFLNYCQEYLSPDTDIINFRLKFKKSALECQLLRGFWTGKISNQY